MNTQTVLSNFARHSHALAGIAGVDLTIHADLDAVADEWKAFEKDADCTAFQLFQWLSKWQRHIGVRAGVVPAVVIGRDAMGGILFLLPLAIERRAGARCLTWLGSALCDYNGPLLAPDFSRRFAAGGFAALWQQITDKLRSDPRFRFDLVDLPKMAADINRQPNPLVELPCDVNPSGAYVATLGSDWTQYYESKRSSATRKKERKQLKQLAEFGEIRFFDLIGRDELQRTAESLIDMKTRSLARMGVDNPFARPGYRDFYLDIITDLAALDFAHVSRLDVGGTIAAANLGLKFRDCYYLVLSSYQDGEFARFGPGRAHLHELLRHAIERGYRRFDFTIGDEPYKRDWSDIELRLHDHLAAVTPLGQAVVAGMMFYRRAKRIIKQTPALWQAFSRLRALRKSIRRS